VDQGYKGHDAPKPHRVFRFSRKRGVFGTIKRKLRRRSTIEAFIGSLKIDGHLGRNYLKGRLGDRVNALLNAAGYNFRLLLHWLRLVSRLIVAVPLSAPLPPERQIAAS
jgi:hypothetical protein